MNKTELIKQYQEFCTETGIAPAYVTLGAGGSLLMFGLRESTADLDLSLPQALFEALREQAPGETQEPGFGLIVHWNDVVDLHLENDDPETEMVEGVKVWTLAYTLKRKLGWNREKDQRDIAAITAELGLA